MEKNEVKKLLTFLSIIILAFSSTKALEPTRVAVVETSGVGPFAISVTLNDYSGGSATNVVGPIAIGNLSPNSSGVISFIVDGAGWSGVPATSVNSHYILDVSVDATLKAQYRLDELTMLQAQTGTGVAQTNGAGAFKSGSGTITAVTTGDNLDMEGNDISNVDNLTGNSGVLRTTSLIYQNLGNDNTAFGNDAANNNTGGAITAIGFEAANNNSGNSIVAVGNEAATNNTGNLSVIIGSGAGFGNSSNRITAIGYEAARVNTGSDATVTGYSAGYQNTGNNITANGSYSAYQNTEARLTAVGYQSGYQNSGARVTAIGNDAGYLNSGARTTAVGNEAAYQNQGNQVVVVGNNAGLTNSGARVVAVGNDAAYQNTGNNVSALGHNTAYQNTGNNVLVLGTNAGTGNAINGQTIISNNVLPEFANRAAAVSAITIGNGAVAGNTYLYYNQATNAIEGIRLP